MVSDENKTTCHECRGGTQPNVRQTGCIACPLGKHAKKGMLRCEACGARQMPAADRTQCVNCGAHMTYSGAQLGCTCDAGYYDSGGGHLVSCVDSLFLGWGDVAASFLSHDNITCQPCGACLACPGAERPHSVAPSQGRKNRTRPSLVFGTMSLMM